MNLELACADVIYPEPVPGHRAERTAFEQLIPLVTNSVRSPHSKTAYARGLRDFLEYVRTKPANSQFNRSLVQEYRTVLESQGKRPASVNQALSAIRKLASEAADTGYLDDGVAASIISLKGVPVRGTRAGKWLGYEEMLTLLLAPDQSTGRGRRDFVLIALLMGAALRRAEACALTVGQVQWRDGRMLLVDVLGKGQRLRSVPIPQSLWGGVNLWIKELRAEAGSPLLRRIDAQGRATNAALSPAGAWWIVRSYAESLGFTGVRPHHLRRNFAKAALKGGADIDAIRAALGHSNAIVTQVYCGQEMHLNNPACEKIGL